MKSSLFAAVIGLTAAMAAPTVSIAAHAQNTAFVRDEGVKTALHWAHLGQVTFMGRPITVEAYKESDFLKAFKLTGTGDLNIRWFMGSSLMNSLHALAPGLTAEELDKAGNYQFTFIVDGTRVYAENVNPGAGGLQSKSSKTVTRIPLISAMDEDSWGRFLWGRFLLNGGDDVLTGGTHILKIEIRPYVKNPDLKTGDKLAEGQLTLDVVRPKIDEARIDVQEIRPGAGWPLSSESFDRGKIRELNRKIAEKVYKDITSLVVIKDGKLLIEEYFNGSNREALQDTRSVGKSFASALLGLAIRDGRIEGLDRRLGEFYDLKSFANPSPKKEAVRLKDLLTMSSAFLGSDNDDRSPGNEENMYPTPNWVKFALDLPMDPSKENGRQWDYFTAGVIVLGDILDKSVPGGLERYADANLFKPLGIGTYKWQYTPQKVVNTAGGLGLRSLDLAKFGQLYKNGGIWNGRAVLPRSWVEATFQKYLPIPILENGFYGLLFWNTAYPVDGRRLETYFCTGNGGNKIFVFTGQPLVIVVTATAYGKPYAHPQVDRMMEKYILPAVIR